MTQDAVSFAESFEAALLSRGLISTQSIPSFDGSLVIAPPLIVTGWCTSVPPGADCLAVPETGPPRRGSRVSGLLEWCKGQGDYVHNYPGTRVRSERALGRDALAKKAGTSREWVRKLEAGVHDLTVGTLQRLATALGVQ